MPRKPIQEGMTRGPLTVRQKLQLAKATEEQADYLLNTFDEKTILYALNYYRVQKNDYASIAEFVLVACNRIYEKRARKNE